MWNPKPSPPFPPRAETEEGEEIPTYCSCYQVTTGDTVTTETTGDKEPEAGAPPSSPEIVENEPEDPAAIDATKDNNDD